MKMMISHLRIELEATLVSEKKKTREAQKGKSFFPAKLDGPVKWQEIC